MPRAEEIARRYAKRMRKASEDQRKGSWMFLGGLGVTLGGLYYAGVNDEFESGLGTTEKLALGAAAAGLALELLGIRRQNNGIREKLEARALSYDAINLYNDHSHGATQPGSGGTPKEPTGTVTDRR